MKIAVMAGKFPSLSETFILNQITGLIDQGHSVEVYGFRPAGTGKIHSDVDRYQLLEKTYYCPDIPGNYFYRFLKAIYILIFWGIRKPTKALRALNIFTLGPAVFSLRFIYYMVPFLEQNCPEYDVIHCHFGVVGIRAITLKALGVLKGSVSVVFHGQDITSYIKTYGPKAYDTLFQKGDLFLPISDRWKKLLLELGCPESKIVVHRMGIDSEQFKYQARHPDIGEIIHITSVARLVEKKGIEYGIRAIACLKQSVPNIAYTIIGDGPLRPDLESLVDELDIADSVILTGWQQQDEVINVLDRSVFFLAPSVTACNGDQEGIPVAIMEAMAMGLVVISSFHSGIPELVKHEMSGFLLPERDAEGIAETMEHLIKHPDICQEVGINARDRIEEEFDVDQLNSRLARLLGQI